MNKKQTRNNVKGKNDNNVTKKRYFFRHYNKEPYHTKICLDIHCSMNTNKHTQVLQYFGRLNHIHPKFFKCKECVTKDESSKPLIPKKSLTWAPKIKEVHIVSRWIGKPVTDIVNV
jgi:hypothetical protein